MDMVSIKQTNGKWTLNGKSYEKMDPIEKRFMNNFFKEVKVSQENNYINQNQTP